MKYTESASIIYNKIKHISGLNDDALILLGISKDKINTALNTLIDSGVSQKVAMRTVLSLWTKADPDVQSKPPTAIEMDMMGFTHKDKVWTHSLTGLQLTDEHVKTTSFRDIESAVFKEAKDQTK